MKTVLDLWHSSQTAIMGRIRPISPEKAAVSDSYDSMKAAYLAANKPITAPLTLQQETHTMSFLSAVGKDFKGLFSWLGSSKGQATIAAGEGLAEGVATAAGFGPAVAGIINISNVWLTEIIKDEALSAAAGQQTGSGPTKAAAVIATLTPQILSFAAEQKMPVPSAAQIATASTALVTFLNVFGAPAGEPPIATPAASPVTT